eukprot:4595823-Pleurochrysis_carterae.AAC.1
MRACEYAGMRSCVACKARRYSSCSGVTEPAAALARARSARLCPPSPPLSHAPSHAAAWLSALHAQLPECGAAAADDDGAAEHDADDCNVADADADADADVAAGCADFPFVPVALERDRKASAQLPAGCFRCSVGVAAGISSG